jgi:hypothetical protein
VFRDWRADDGKSLSEVYAEVAQYLTSKSAYIPQLDILAYGSGKCK